jgi:hypothetical protein
MKVLRNEYKENEFKKIISESNSIKDVLLKLNLKKTGGTYKTIKKYIKLYNCDISHFSSITNEGIRKEIPLVEILISGSTYTHVKERLYKEGLKTRECELCGQGEEWMGNKMSLILDHINGVNNDNRLENLRIVCPNCNATLNTHCKGAAYYKRKNEKIEKKRINLLERSLKQRKNERPTYTDLINYINNDGYLATSRRYNVSESTIRRWVRFYINIEN